jgi:hypothetical protein
MGEQNDALSQPKVVHGTGSIDKSETPPLAEIH